MKTIFYGLCCFIVIQLSAYAQSKTQVQYQNQVVFSSSKIEKDKEEPSKFITTYTLGDPLFFRQYFEKPIMAYFQDYNKSIAKTFPKRCHQTFAVYIEGYDYVEGITYFPWGADKEAMNSWTTTGGTIFDAGVEVKQMGTAVKKAFLQLAARNALVPGKTYNLIIKTFVNEGTFGSAEDKKVLLNQGQLTVKVTQEGINKYKPMLCEAMAALITDKKFEALVKELYSTKTLSIKKVAIMDKDWNPVRDVATGAVLKREMNVNVLYENPNDGCYVYWDVVYQKFDGKAYQQTLFHDQDIYHVKGKLDGNRIPCFCVD